MQFLLQRQKIFGGPSKQIWLFHKLNTGANKQDKKSHTNIQNIKFSR